MIAFTGRRYESDRSTRHKPSAFRMVLLFTLGSFLATHSLQEQLWAEEIHVSVETDSALVLTFYSEDVLNEASVMLSQIFSENFPWWTFGTSRRGAVYITVSLKVGAYGRYDLLLDINDSRTASKRFSKSIAWLDPAQIYEEGGPPTAKRMPGRISKAVYQEIIYKDQETLRRVFYTVPLSSGKRFLWDLGVSGRISVLAVLPLPDERYGNLRRSLFWAECLLRQDERTIVPVDLNLMGLGAAKMYSNEGDAFRGISALLTRLQIADKELDPSKERQKLLSMSEWVLYLQEYKLTSLKPVE